jgi:hypothetical protein
MLDQLNYSVFAQYLNQPFQVHLDTDQTIEIELVQAIDRSGGANKPTGYESFSLVFRGPQEPFLEQATYLMRQEAIGEFPLFIVPVRADQEGQYYYEAVFTRLSDPPSS